MSFLRIHVEPRCSAASVFVSVIHKNSLEDAKILALLLKLNVCFTKRNQSQFYLNNRKDIPYLTVLSLVFKFQKY